MPTSILLTANELAFAFEIVRFLAEHAESIRQIEHEDLETNSCDADWSLAKTLELVEEACGNEMEAFLDLILLDSVVVEAPAYVLTTFFTTNQNSGFSTRRFDALPFSNAEIAKSVTHENPLWIPRGLFEAIANGSITERMLER